MQQLCMVFIIGLAAASSAIGEGGNGLTAAAPQEAQAVGEPRPLSLADARRVLSVQARQEEITAQARHQQRLNRQEMICPVLADARCLLSMQARQEEPRAQAWAARHMQGAQP